MKRRRRDGPGAGGAAARALFAVAVIANLAFGDGPLASVAFAQEPAAAPAEMEPAAAPAEITTNDGIAFEALDAAQRRAVQRDLIWTGDYAGTVDGVFGPRTYAAIVSWQRSLGLQQSGVLSPADRARLAAQAQAAREEADFAVLDDPRSGARIGVPQALLSKRSDAPPPNGASRWQTPDERVTLDTRVVQPGEGDLAAIYERLTATPIPGRTVTYNVLRETFFVVAGETAEGKFYLRYDSAPDADGSEIRGFSIGYAKTLAPRFDALTLAIADSFVAFPAVPAGPAPSIAGPSAAESAPTAPAPPAPYATGLVIGPEAVLTSASVDACARLRVGSGEARERRRIGSDALVVTVAHGRATAPGPVAAASGSPDGGAPPSGEGIALAASGEGDLSVVPGLIEAGRFFAPLQPGAAGAPVFDREGALLGLVLDVAREPARIAGVAPSSSATLVPASAFSEAIEGAPPADAGERWTAGRISQTYGGLVVALACAD